MVEDEKRQVFLKPMEIFHCAPDDSSYKGERINRYFQEVADLIGYSKKAQEVFLKVYVNTLGFEDGPKLAPTNDFTHILKAEGQIVAFVLETRDDFNFIDVALACTITPELLEQLRSQTHLLK